LSAADVISRDFAFQSIGKKAGPSDDAIEGAASFDVVSAELIAREA